MRGKCIPLTWLHVLLTRIAPKDHPGRIVHLDLGGETGKNPEIAALFLKHQYILQPTGVGASSQNGSGERPHSTIGNAIRAMIYSANLPPKFWEYAFYFYLRVHTVLPHGKNKLSPYQLIKGTPADVSNLRTFGCLMYAISTKRRDAKLTTENIIRAKFLGYGGSMKTFICITSRHINAVEQLTLGLMKHSSTHPPPHCRRIRAPCGEPFNVHLAPMPRTLRLSSLHPTNSAFLPTILHFSRSPRFSSRFVALSTLLGSFLKLTPCRIATSSQTSHPYPRHLIWIGPDKSSFTLSSR
jgi:hypothetical protein